MPGMPAAVSPPAPSEITLLSTHQSIQARHTQPKNTPALRDPSHELPVTTHNPKNDTTMRGKPYIAPDLPPFRSLAALAVAVDELTFVEGFEQGLASL